MCSSDLSTERKIVCAEGRKVKNCSKTAGSLELITGVRSNDFPFKELLNFPAFNARSVMKMAAEELMADEAFATLILYFNAWENIS